MPKYNHRWTQMNTDKVIARPLFGRAEICSTDNDLLPGEARPELSPGICNAIGEIARSLRRNVAASRLPIAPFPSIWICFGFRVSDFVTVHSLEAQRSGKLIAVKRK
jgi:hypothetical protein